MDKIKFLKYLVLGLFLVNVLTISSLFFFEKNNNNRKNEHARPEKIIIDQLNFDKTQQEQYRKLITWHRNRIDTFENQIKNNLPLLHLQNQLQ
jgi:hypothetical protein